MPLQSIESTALLPWQFINSVDTNYVVSKLNKKYDLNLIRKNITGSDFIVELDANSVSGLM